MGTTIEVIKHSENGRTALYQWDTGRKIKIQSEKMVDEVHFSNVLSKGALVVTPNIDAENGAITADIPNILLQTFMVIDVWIVCHSENGEYTNNHEKLDVMKRPKPSDYVYTETEVKNWDALERRIKELEDNQTSDETIKEAVEDYLERNPVEIEVDKTLSEESENPVANKAVAKAIKDVDGKIPTDYVSEEALESKGYLTEHQPLDDYAKKSELPSKLPASDVYSWAKQPTKPAYTADEVGALSASTKIPSTPEAVGADAKGTADAKVGEHNVSELAHNDIRLLIKNLTTKVAALLDSDDATLDQTSEIVAYIKSNKSLIEAITTNKVSVTDIVDNLTTSLSNKPLSAKQGAVLKSLIDEVKTALGKITIPTKLPNPQKLTFEGAVSAEYDGSGAVVVTIPSGQGTERIEKDTVDTDVTLEPNKLYIFPEMATLNITLSDNVDASLANEFHFVFQSGATATTLTIPDIISIPDGFAVGANKIYEISILESMMLAQSWAVS